MDPARGVGLRQGHALPVAEPGEDRGEVRGVAVDEDAAVAVQEVRQVP